MSSLILRKAELEIKDWIRHPGKALLVTGVRQAGKTFSIRRCLREESCDYVEINLIQRPDALRALESSMTVQDLILNLSAIMTGTRFAPGKTFLFLDEIQEFKELVTKIKFWVDEGSFRFVLSGSLLGVELRGLRSAPVGYLHEIQMYPLDFEEFLLASGVHEETISYMSECFEHRKALLEPVHEALMKHFRRYLVVGGMPEAVKMYIETGDLNRVSAVQKDILDIYKMDFTKYELEDRRLMLISVFDQIPAQLLRQNRRFHFSDVQKKLRFERISGSFLWLSNAGVAIPSYNATAPRVSLTQNENSSLFKLYSSDVGLLTWQYGAALRQKILLEDSLLNLGGIFENFAAQELNAHGFPLFFYLQPRSAEVDFLVAWQNQILPIEVKSGKEYQKHASLDRLMSDEHNGLKQAFVLSPANLSMKEGICYCPIYLCGWIRNEVPQPALDISPIPAL